MHDAKHTWFLEWNPAWQTFGNLEEYIQHEGPIPTNPSHDLVHLILGAHGGLPWLPYRDRVQSYMAEYNAVLLENLYHLCCPTHTYTGEQVWQELRRYMQWFVDVHYAPFPCSAADAWAAFQTALNVERALHWFPLFGQMRWMELHQTDYRQKHHQLTFYSHENPLQTRTLTFPKAWIDRVKKALILVKERQTL